MRHYMRIVPFLFQGHRVIHHEFENGRIAPLRCTGQGKFKSRVGELCLVVLALGLALAACTVNPVPEGYTGPIAYISDSAHAAGSTRGDMFYVTHVNGQRISDRAASTRSANYGRGFRMTPSVIGRKIPAQGPTTFTIMGRTQVGAPIQALFVTMFEVTGDVTFTPQPDRTYIVRGVLGKDYSAVWIEDVQTSEVIDKKIEIKGSAALGILQK
jgi:hypothetical protein